MECRRYLYHRARIHLNARAELLKSQSGIPERRDRCGRCRRDAGAPPPPRGALRVGPEGRRRYGLPCYLHPDS